MSLRFLQFLKRVVTIFAAAFVLTSAVTAQVSEQVIVNFTGQYNGYGPQSPLLKDGSGRLYGTTIAGGNKSSICPVGCGVLFELAPNATGGWNYRRLYAFTGDNDDQPLGELVNDATGNLYGVALGNGNTAGEVFKLSPVIGGQWTESIIHTFGGAGDGSQPWGGLSTDSAGNLYGTTRYGGANGGGTVYELTPNSNGTWTETILHSFAALGQGPDGNTPMAGVIFDSAGNLYGTTYSGGAYGWGTVFEMSPILGGGWTESVLYSFTGHTDQAHPQARLWQDPKGNLYGTTYGNAIHSIGYGTVFELLNKSDGSWSEHTLHVFSGGSGDGAYPGSGSLVPDQSGHLYGTTPMGGVSGGVLYKMTRSGGTWAESVIYNFGGTNDALNPYSVTFSNGVLYGTSQRGGSSGYGTVFAVTP
jgi:uncharacterized repeat protein (TIGR03803 family)